MTSSECSVQSYSVSNNSHFGDQMSTRFGDDDQGMTLDTNMLGATRAPFIVQIESDEQGQAIIDYDR
ncbi:hypothetical protein SAMN05421848_1702 [Kushneria avicenniae]|uniref:Uncharacterized protein n=1 Tax=Kushneria avicenniae TaxID=402385 RepID=A0A1I1JQ55_9GAMM|nr:hypothetical protein [Kushneria avicenniae]SFC50759.1 hypothetical protein SAMN05421848_1702 [Kushneria avicenniae]